MAANNTVMIDLLLNAEQANQRLAKLEKNISGFGDKATSMFGKMKLAWTSFVGNFASQAASKAFEIITASAKKMFDVFVVGGVAAALEAEEALNALNVALAQTGIYSEGTSRDLQEFASQIQATTRFEDDAVIKSMALLQSLGQLDSQGLKRGTRAAVDMASALNIDLNTAMQLLGKAAQGEIGTLSRYGIIVEKGSSSAETFSKVLGLIESRFGGSAQGKVKTYAGALDQAKNAFGDLVEKTGNFIVKNPVVIKILNDVTAGFISLSEWVDKNSEAILQMVNTAIPIAIKGLSLMVEFLDNLTAPAVKFFQIMKGDFEAAFSATPLENMADALNNYANEIDGFAMKHQGFTNQIVKQDQEMAKKQKSLWKMVTDYYTGQNADRLNNMKSTLGTIASMTGTTHGMLFQIGKGAAVAQATIDGIVAVQKALSSAPPPFNFALAALVGAATAANVAKISSQQPPAFERGGIIGGSSTRGDQVLIRANSRETILTMEDQKSLLGAIRGGGMGGMTVNIANVNASDQNDVDTLIERIREAVAYRNQPLLAGVY